MGSRIIILFIFFCAVSMPYASGETLEITDAAELSAIEENMFGDKIKNACLLESVFEKLIQLENTREGKINIVHIGDSHIQADYFTNAIRQPLQEKFGNAGYGFTLPYRMVKSSSGTNFIRYVSNTAWTSCRNNQAFKCDPNTEIGLSGYGLTTKNNQFVISMEVTEEKYKFNTIKVLSPYKTSCFHLATSEKNPVISSVQSTVKYHKIQSGESLSVIASKYKVTVAAIKKENNLKSNTIYAGKSLKIPVTTRETKVDRSVFDILDYDTADNYISTYYCEEPVSKLYLIPTDDYYIYNLNGLVVENDDHGLIYHSVGVVGSKASDFNQNPLFFQQLPVLNPDLLIVSFGTNESYGRVSREDFMSQMKEFADNLQKACPDVPILIMTPPTSLFPRRALNRYASDYSAALMNLQEFPLWDLYTFTGGLEGAKKPMLNLISSDNVHYTAQGYINQGSAFAYDFIDTYENYKKDNEIEIIEQEDIFHRLMIP